MKAICVHVSVPFIKRATWIFFLLALVFSVAYPIFLRDRDRSRTGLAVKLLLLFESVGCDEKMLATKCRDVGIKDFEFIIFTDPQSNIFLIEDPQHVKESTLVALGRDGKSFTIRWFDAVEHVNRFQNILRLSSSDSRRE